MQRDVFGIFRKGFFLLVGVPISNQDDRMMFSWMVSRRLRWRSRGGKSRSIQAGPIFQQPLSLPESAQTLAGIASRAARRSGKNFPAASRFAGKRFQQGILDSHSPLESSECPGWTQTSNENSDQQRIFAQISLERICTSGCINANSLTIHHT